MVAKKGVLEGFYKIIEEEMERELYISENFVEGNIPLWLFQIRL